MSNEEWWSDLLQKLRERRAEFFIFDSAFFDFFRGFKRASMDVVLGQQVAWLEREHRQNGPGTADVLHPPAKMRGMKVKS